ncbi:MAG: NADH-quinone oxidoreductase subunit L [Rhodobacteraceae bacterium]|nr:NADH-quinone oxidoreductase subunit L [Paracoccaceae bacterium]
MPVIILFAPLVGALIAGFGWRIIGEQNAKFVSTGLLFLAAFLSWIVFFGQYDVAETITIMRWLESGSLSVDWAIRMDRLTQIMLVVVTTVSALVHLYSIGYMKDDPQWRKGESYEPRFFAYLSFFTFSMLMLVTSDNLLQMFFGWEGVGVASYLLIGFYYRKPSANAAAMKAFIVNRVGDFGFALGIFGLFLMTDSINFDDIFAAGHELSQVKMEFLGMTMNAAGILTLLLFIGAMGKSAQLFLHTWLPDAMEGPTPVSALIHAATMVTAGVFLVVRMSPVFEYAPGTLAFVTYVGATTAFVAATIGLVQNDIKRVIAYSTMSQLGYMFAAAGVGAYQVAIFHLFTHAFFKAMLFLGAGSVITAMHHEQDMRNYGGLRHKIPKTFWAMMIGTLAITGVGIPLTTIGFAGFLSKDAIIETTFAAGTAAGSYAFYMLVFSAAMTSFYSWRLMFMTFYGDPRGDKHTHDHAHESPLVMLIPLLVLAVGSAFAGMLWYPEFFGDNVTAWFGEAVYVNHETNTVIHDAHYVPKWVKVSPFVAMLSGFLAAYYFYIRNPEAPKALAKRNPGLYQFLLNKWYFDELIDLVIVNPSKRLGTFLWKKVDGVVIDGALNGLAMGIIPWLTRLANRWQSGYVFTYAFAMIIGVGAIITWFVFTRGAQ